MPTSNSPYGERLQVSEKVPTFHISSFEDLYRTVSELSNNNQYRLVFRGQTEHYDSILPSAFRPNVQPPSPNVIRFFTVFLEHIQNKWEGEFYGQFFYKFNPRDLHALMQHYGFPTEFLDVTYDLEIALWFATRKFMRVDRNCGRYVSMTNPGIIYIFNSVEHLTAIPDIQDGKMRVVSLKETEGALSWHNPARIKQQKAALLTGATKINPDLSKHLYASLIINEEIQQDPSWDAFSKRYSVYSLFYTSDYFYTSTLMYFNKNYLDESLLILEHEGMSEGVERFWASQVEEEGKEEKRRNIWRPSAPWW